MMKKMDMLLKNGTIVTPEESFSGMIGIADGKIQLICQNDMDIEADIEVDLSDKHILPGAIDPHVHFQDPGFTDREDFEHGTCAAAAGGITTAISHPLNLPPATTLGNFAFTEAAYKGKAYIDYALHAGATGENIDDIADLWKETGATSVKMFMCFSVAEFPYVDDGAMLRVLEKVAANNAVAIIHAENDGMLKMLEKKMKALGHNDGMAYNLTHPKEAEIEAIQRALYFLAVTGAEGVILHVSTAEGLELIHKAKESGVKVWAESAPHLFHFTDDCMKDKGPYLKFSPVMHDKDNQEKMWELLGKGYVDSIGSDHSPYTLAEKQAGESDIWKAPNGIPGIETNLAVFLDGVNRGKLTINQLARMISTNTAKIYGLYPRKGSMQIGTDADFTIVDLNDRHAVESAQLKSKCKWSPYSGEVFHGWPYMTIVRGKIIYEHGRIIGEKGYGKEIKRSKS